MKKVKALRYPKQARDINRRPITAGDVASRQVPARLVRNIRRGHLIRAMRDIGHTEWKPREEAVSRMQRAWEKKQFDKANRFYNALSQERVDMGLSRKADPKSNKEKDSK